MSVTIHLEDFQSWSEIFEEIEKQRKKGRRIGFGGANKSNHKPAGIQPIARSTSSPCCAISDGINPYNLHNDSRFTEKAAEAEQRENGITVRGHSQASRCLFNFD